MSYLRNAENLSQEWFERAASIYEAKIMPKDLLRISVTSETPGAAADFNLSFPYKMNTTTGSATSETFVLREENTYLVDHEGCINFPVLGKLKLGGLTKNEAEMLIFSQIYPEYLTEKPFIDIRFLNFSITVLGEVAKPGIYKAENEQMTIFDALAAAGDMTVYGKRNSVLLIRTLDNGELSVMRVNLLDRDVLLDRSIYYLQQNDKIYVEMNRTRANSHNFGVAESAALSVVSLLVSIASLFVYYGIYNNK
jgi:polysaccharide export outer membrane protein